MTTKNTTPELSRRKAMAAMAVGLITAPKAAHLLISGTSAAETFVGTTPAIPAIEPERFLLTF